MGWEREGSDAESDEGGEASEGRGMQSDIEPLLGVAGVGPERGSGVGGGWCCGAGGERDKRSTLCMRSLPPSLAPRSLPPSLPPSPSLALSLPLPLPFSLSL
jgi:hypothetical protein